jgi:Zn-dependent protease
MIENEVKLRGKIKSAMTYPIAVVALVILKVLLVAGALDSGGGLGSFAEPVKLLLFEALLLNASLAVFNLLPIPPLDGSKVLYSVLPASAQPVLEALERYSFLILIGAIYLGVFDVLFAPVARVIVFLLRL